MFTPVRIYDYLWAFSLIHKQTAYGTATADASLINAIPIIGYDTPETTQTKYTDQSRIGKGHEFSTVERELMRDIRLARTMDLSSAMGAFVAAFVMGSDAITSLSPGYSHVLTLANPANGKQVPVFTIAEQPLGPGAANMIRRIRDLALNDFTMSGRAGEVSQLQFNAIGSGFTSSGAFSGGFPGITTTHVLDSLLAVFKIGVQGSGGALGGTDITTRLDDWSFTVSCSLDEKNGYQPGGGIYRTRMWFGERKVSAKFTVWVDNSQSDMFDALLAQTEQEISLTLTGDTVGGITHSMQALWPATRFTAVKIAQNQKDDKVCYMITINDADIYLDGTGTVNQAFQLTFVNDITAYLS